MSRCPVCEDPIRVDMVIHVHLTWATALKLWLAGPEARVSLLDELRLHLAEAALRRAHPENS